MKERMVKIIDALNNNLINLDNFDSSYANEHESHPHQQIDQELVKITNHEFEVNNDVSFPT